MPVGPLDRELGYAAECPTLEATEPTPGTRVRPTTKGRALATLSNMGAGRLFGLATTPWPDLPQYFEDSCGLLRKRRHWRSTRLDGRIASNRTPVLDEVTHALRATRACAVYWSAGL